MGLRENLSKLSPNEFLEKMQNMFQMYQESQDDYYEEDYKENIKIMKQQNEIDKYDREFFEKSIFSEGIIDKLKKLEELITRIIANSKYKPSLINDIYKKFSRVKIKYGSLTKTKIETLNDLIYVLGETMDKFPGIKI